jgi:hypothetical protein
LGSVQWAALAAELVWSCILVLLVLQFGKVTCAGCACCNTLNMFFKDIMRQQ